ncbi:MAG: hypothetical protein ABDI20_01995 [Candidatus Bipolaricaulaceae bacterium]
MKRQNRQWLGWTAAALALLSLAGCQYLFGGFAPPPPSEFAVTDGTFPDRVRLTWSPVPQAGGYEVWRGPSAQGEFTLLAKTAYTSYDDPSVVPGTAYWYKVRACNRAGCGAFTPVKRGSAQVPGVPPTPTGLSASQGTFTDRVRLTWQAAQGATSYEVYRAPAEAGPYALLATVTTPTHDDTQVEAGKVYWYKVRACSAAGCSALSAAVSGYAALATLPAPQNVQASDGTEPGKVVVTWQAVQGATHYLVYRALSQDGDYTHLATVAATTYEDADVEPGKTYWYRVRACNAQGCSVLSDPDSGTPGEGEAPPPPPPSPTD